jgi:ligand-binding sensor domain-containing protein
MNKIGIILSFFIGFCSLRIHCQNDNYFTYSLNEGLPQSQVFCLTQDQRGFIYAGTQGGGVARFDGVGFKVFTSQNGLSSDFINCLMVSDKNSELYIGTSRGLNGLINNKLEAYNLVDGKSVFITAICEVNEVLYCGSSDGIYLVNKPAKKRMVDPIFDKLKNHYINDVESIGNEIWIGTNKGLWIYDTLKKNLSKSNKAPQPNVAHIYNDGKFVWLSILDYGLIKLDPSTKSILTKLVNEEIRKCLALNLDLENNLWIATQNNGLYKFSVNSNELENIRDKDFTTTKLRSLYRDHWDNLWIGTSGEGIVKKANQTFKHYLPTEFGFKNNKVYSIFPNDKNQILFATGDNQVISYNGKMFNKIFSDSSKIKLKSIVADSSNNLWIGTEGKGLIKQNANGEREELSYSRGNFIDDIIVQLIQKDNLIYVATNSSGIVKIEGNYFTTINSKKGLADDYVSGIAIDSKNNLWYTTKKGKLGFVSKNNKVVNIPTSNKFYSQAIKSIAIDKNDNIYITIMGDGLYRYKPLTKDLEKIQAKEKMFSNNIYSMVFTPQGNLWLGVENGCYELKFGSDQNLTAVKYFSKGDGFLGLESCHNSSCVDDQDNIWFGTMNGISVLNADNKKETKKSPILHVNETLLFYKPINETKYKKSFIIDHTLPYDQNHISFQFKAIHLNHSDKIKYRVKLDGADQQWSSWENKEEVNYANLNSGNYTFLAQASLDGQYLGNEVKVPFTISTPFWEKWWFRLLFIASALGGIIYFFKKRESNIREKEAQKNKDLEIKNELLSLEQKALQLQMNPHFIFNALNSIQSVIVDQDVDKARLEIQNFALLMRSILNNSRKKTISINEELQTIRKYLELEQFCQKNKFTFTIDIAQDIDTEETEIPSMLLQPYIENAVIHGISHLKYDGKISITFNKDNEVLICEIEDNGVGRTKAKELALGTKSHVSLGMDVTETRLNNYAEGKIKDPQAIIDLLDDKGQAKGTKVILKIPITTSY